MTALTPFEADCLRKTEAYAQYHDQYRRRNTCMECGSVRPYLCEGQPHRFRRCRSDKEWAEWVGYALPKEER